MTAFDMGAYEAWDPTLIFYDGFESGGTWGWNTDVETSHYQQFSAPG